MHVFAPCILSLFSVPTMVNLGEIKLHIGVDYGKKTRTGSHITHAQAVAVSPVSEGDKAAHPAFCVHTVSPPLQMIHGRTTESPSAKPWDCCYVSTFTPLHSSPKLLTLFRMSLWRTINAFGLFPNPDHILEHSEDDTKSLFVIIKVSSLFDFSITHVWNVIILPCGRPAKVSQCPLSVCLIRLCDDRSSVTSCFSEALTRRSLTHAGKASLLSRSPWKTGWVRKAQQGRRLLSVSLSQWKGDSSMSSFLMQLHGKKQHIRALLIDRVLLQHEVSLTTHLLKSSQLILCTSNNKIICVLLFSVRTFCVFCVSRWGSWWLTAVNIKWFIRSCSVICCCFRPALTAR